MALEIFTIDIFPMSRHDALIELASQTGHDILFGEGAIPRNYFKGENGNYSIVEALDILLTSSNFVYKLVGKQIRIQRDENKSTVLPKLTVIGYLRDTTAQITQNEDGQEYFPLYQMPLSIQSIPKKYMDKVQVRTVDDILSYVSGVDYFELWAGLYPQYYSRGMPALFGVDGKFYRRTIIQINPVLLSRVDVVQGPKANYFQPGGMLNLVTKKPMRRSQYELSIKAGSEEYFRGDIDLNLASKQSDKWSMRVIAAAEKQNYFRDFAFGEMQVLSPSVDFDFSENVQLLITANYQNERRYPSVYTFHESVLADPLPREQTLGVPWAESRITVSSLTADLSDRDWQGWRLSSGINYSNGSADMSQALLTPIDGQGQAVLSHVYVKDVSARSHGFDAAVEKEIPFFGYATLFRFGVDYQYYEKRMPSYMLRMLENQNGSPVFNLYQRDYYHLERPEAPERMKVSLQKTDVWAANITQRFYVTDNFSIHADIRYEDMGTETIVKTEIQLEDATEAGSGSVSSSGHTRQRLLRRYSEFTPQLGVNLSLNDSFSSHLSYSESFTNQAMLIYDAINSGVDDQVDSNPPIKTRQFELAFKKTWLDDSLSNSLTFYSLTTSNIFLPSGGSQTFEYIPADEQSSKGVDLSLSGSLNDNITLITNLNYNKNNFSVVGSGGADIGYSFFGSPDSGHSRLRGTAKYLANFWMNYEITRGIFKDFGIGFGVKYVGDRYVDDANRYELPAYIKVDTFVEYKGFSNLTLSLSVLNVFDKRYARSSWEGRRYIEEGDPRSVFLSVKSRQKF